MAPKRKAATSSTSDSESGGKAKKASTSSSASSKQESTSASSSSSAKGAGRYFLMKSESHEFSIDDLGARPNQESWWEGVRNYQARNIMRDQMKVGDLAFFYHSSCKVPGIVGIMEISKEAYPDHFQFDKSSKYYDAGSKKEEPRWMMVDVRLKEKFPEILPLEELRKHSDGALKDMLLLKKGSRLSVQPVSQEEWDYIQRLLKEKNANSTSQ